MTDRELELLTGHRAGPTIVFVIFRGRAFHRDGPDDWREYDPYPDPPDDGPAAA